MTPYLLFFVQTFSPGGVKDKRLHLSHVKGIFLFKTDQPHISEQCKWALPIHSSVICHKSQGLHEDFEMLIQLSMVTSLSTFKNTTDLSFMCAWKLWRLTLSPQLSKMSKLNMKFRLALTASKVRTFSFFLSPYIWKRWYKSHCFAISTGQSRSHVKSSKQITYNLITYLHGTR